MYAVAVAVLMLKSSLDYGYALVGAAGRRRSPLGAQLCAHTLLEQAMELETLRAHSVRVALVHVSTACTCYYC